MSRFYTPNADFSLGALVEITDPKELHHLKNVLRLPKDAPVRLFNDKGEEAGGTIARISDQKVTVRVDSVKKINPVRHPRIILACAIPKKSKFEWIIEKAAELGAAEIIPTRTQRTEIQLKGERLAKKRERFETVAVNAAKQCGRPDVPEIHPVTAFPKVLEDWRDKAVLVIPSLSNPREDLFETLRRISEPALPERLVFLIGPEGDFTPAEYAQARRAGALPVSLGETVLKVETAAICVTACAKLFFKESGP